MKRRFRIDLQYDGARFQGWQRQAEGVATVQGAVETALEKLLGERVTVNGAGRTDSGVHAAAMPAHFDCEAAIPPENLAVALGKFLPHGIAVLGAARVAEAFDARRDARLRWYRYQVLNARGRRPLGPRAWVVHRRLETGAMTEALALLEGEYDFEGFRSAQCQAVRTKLTMREARLSVREFEAVEAGARLMAFDFKCRSFLHHQVRFMVGSVVAVGLGMLTVERVLRIRDEFARPELAACAPPEGLCLMGVGYGDVECAGLLAAKPEPPSF